MAISTSCQGSSSCRTSLQDLPLELLITIANLSSGHELRSLRRVSRLLERTTYEAWRKCCCTAITIDTATEDLDWHLDHFNMSRTIGHDAHLVRLVFSSLTASNMSSTMKCLTRLPELLALLPQVNSLTLVSLGALAEEHVWLGLSKRPLPSIAGLCQLFDRYNIEYLHLMNSHFSAWELRMLLSTLDPKRLSIDRSLMFNTRTDRHGIIPEYASPPPGDPFKLTVVSPPTRLDVGHSYFDQWPQHGEFTGTMHVYSSSGSQDYTVSGNSCSKGYELLVTKTWIERSREKQ